MDTVIFLLIFASFWAMRGRMRGVAIPLYFASVLATILLFKLHVTSSLKLGF